jgi:hypothetical protein
MKSPNKFKIYIKTKKNLIDAINKYGFVPFFANRIRGFSIEENVSEDIWWNGKDGWKVWEWKGPIINEIHCAYGKFFNNKAVFISKEWFYDFANYRRDGYDFDARYDDGLVSRREKELYNLIYENEPVISKKLKQLGNYKKGGKVGFETLITHLQESCYVLTSDFTYLKDKNGNDYGWGVAEYSTPEKFFGKSFLNKVYKRTPEESYKKLFAHLKSILPNATDDEIKRILK